jgi:RNA polymerase sigma-70 factor (ECF subfamily)
LKKHPADDPIRAALARDDPAAVELLWDRYADDLLAFLQARLGSRHDAEDVLQAVFVRIVRKRRQLAQARQLNAYVYQIARNEAAQYQRSRQRKGVVGSEREPWLVATQSDDAGKELAEQLQAALAQLSPEQREVVVLKMYREKTFREIAGLLHVSLNTAASRYRYGLEKLRTLLEDLMS